MSLPRCKLQESYNELRELLNAKTARKLISMTQEASKLGHYLAADCDNHLLNTVNLKISTLEASWRIDLLEPKTISAAPGS